MSQNAGKAAYFAASDVKKFRQRAAKPPEQPLIQLSPAGAVSKGRGALWSRPAGREIPRAAGAMLRRARTKGELKTVLWTVFKRGKPCDRGLSPTGLNTFMAFFDNLKRHTFIPLSLFPGG